MLKIFSLLKSGHNPFVSKAAQTLGLRGKNAEEEMKEKLMIILGNEYIFVACPSFLGSPDEAGRMQTWTLCFLA